ncbi:N-acetylmuramoyl-L-alanine amidase [Parablautia muri]|uniref:N-acetylmuramoyl-L-alanine amidase n=1 Tax=Parablautia muri TaxID=2320879 RepID=A0A9X5GUC2_9FIRM|nr:N-acetylmuramoyl-L-alanine amidase [Parablautia muri]NBJ95019.1 N-acetylmuramoyl-L-alanine amidase [Parablautia muri]
MNLIQNYLTQSGCYKAGKHITVKGLMIHSVGCPQPKADAFMKNWNRADANACVHAIIEPGGDVYQLLPWEHRGWHCGGNANNTHIGVEMTEPATIRYTSGANWTETGTGENTKAHVLITYQYAVKLFAHLCLQYNLDPLADGVVISHSEGCKRGIASNHGDVEHLWSKFGLTMEQFRKDIKAAMGGDSLTAIMGKAVATVEQMKSYLKKKNPSVEQSVLDMIPLYLSEGEVEGVRGDIAFAQSCLETGNFAFSGSAVTLSQNNFCGLGVTQRGRAGLSFDTPQLGIRAQMQHLKAYASTDALVNEKIDSRFRYVTRGCAPYVEWLGQKENPQGKGWAAGEKYGEKILSILKAVISEGKVQFMESLTFSAPYMVRVSIPDLNIRKGPGTAFPKTGKFTGVGIFTVVEEKDGWGLLKAYQEKRDGWISLSFTTRI